jgi:polyribonucleotide nucleotidyltransferase
LEDSEKENIYTQPVVYAIKVKAELDERISHHIRALKYMEGGYSKKRWIQEAIKEKLQNCQKKEIEKSQSDRTLNFSISRHTHDEIDKIIRVLKKLKISTSKTEFFIEAIIEKLERDEENIKKLFQNMLKISSEASHKFSKAT